ncbi:MAG: NAD(P)-binding domain-containing protein [Hyphomicrobiaceae bacterium]
MARHAVVRLTRHDPFEIAHEMIFKDPTLHLMFLGAPLLALMAGFALSRRRVESHSRALLADSKADGLMEPPTLHPLIDPGLCVDCGACTQVCPEGEVLGLIANKAVLVQPASCIGHGACKAACPHDAIELVFGTRRRGIDIPAVSPSFESNVPGLFIAGELGGMGLIANAIEQGQQAIEGVARLPGLRRWQERYDVVIIGAGPAGIAASLKAKALGLSAVTLEQDTFGGTVAHYPRGKLVMTRPVQLALTGEMALGEVRKEALLAYWRKVLDQHPVRIRYREKVERVVPSGDGFTVVAAGGAQYPTRAVVLAIGRRGTPRQLGVPGEDLSKVVYRLADPIQFKARRVGRGRWRQCAGKRRRRWPRRGNASVSLSYRGERFSRAKRRNRDVLRPLWRAAVWSRSCPG